MKENVRVLGAPMVHYGRLFHCQFIGSPSEIHEQLMHLLVGAQFACNETARSQRI